MASPIPHADLGQTFRVLFADDSPESQALIRFYAQGSPYQVDIVGSGEAAVALFQCKQFDLILIDQHMPGIDGFTATRMIRAWESSHHRSPTPIVALTADSSLEARTQGQAAGCTAYIAKPISKDLLVDVLQTYCTPSSGSRATGRDSASTRIEALIEEEIARRRPLFLDNRRQDLERMQDAIERGDYEIIRTMGHRIKGLAGSYGFPDIGLAGAQLEQAATNQDLASIRQAIDQLSAILTRARQVA